MNDRIIEFRAWDKFEKKMIDWDECLKNEVLIPEILLNSERYEPMQCTGLKDKNGRRVYEGDIVRIFYDHFNGTFTEKEVVGPVKWECGTWVVNNSFLHHSPEYDETNLESASVEVIGNIHENPELLEANNGK